MLPPDQLSVVAFAPVELHNAESSHACGHRVTFHADASDVEPFRRLTKARKNKAGGRYRLILTRGDDPLIDMEALFLGWSATHSAGAKLKFEITPDAYELFREMPARMGHSKEPMAWRLIMYEVGDDEKIVDQAQKESSETIKGGLLAQRAGRLCADETFRLWVAVQRGKEGRCSQEEAAEFIRSRCRIQSRRELDHDEGALERFRKWIERPFAIWSTPV